METTCRNLLDHLDGMPYTLSDVLSLRKKYSGKISSVRLQECITTIPEFVKVLKKREELDEETLREVIRRLRPDEETPELHHRRHQPPEVFHPVPPDPVDRIFQIISEDVGHKWKELARALGAKEGQIDDLEIHHRRISERVLLILDYHHQTCDPRRWRTELTTALATARRSDLALKVNNEWDIRC